MKTLVAAIAVGMVLAAAPAWAVEEHHQPGAASSTPGAPAQTAPTTPAPTGQSSPGMGMGMMGDGMGMMGGQGGMMSCPMMGMMGGRQQGAMSGMMDFAQHVEGHVAFLKAELKITDAQEGSWKPFADALRGLAKTSGGMAGGTGMMMGGGAAQPAMPLDKKLEQQEQALAAKLEAAKALRATYAKLGAVLSEQQKAAADKLLPSYLRMM